MKIELNEDDLEQLDLLLENEIKENEDYLENIKDKEEKIYYYDLIIEQKNLKDRLLIEKNIVLQQLDNMIENEIDYWKEKRFEIEQEVRESEIKLNEEEFLKNE